MVRMSAEVERPTAHEAVAAYKRLARVEPAFRKYIGRDGGRCRSSTSSWDALLQI